MVIGLVLPPTAGSAALPPVGATGASGASGPSVTPAALQPAPARISVRLRGASDHTVHVGNHVKAIGRLRPFVSGQHVSVILSRNGQTIKRTSPLVQKIKGKNAGRFNLRSRALIKPGDYHVRAFHKRTADQLHDADNTHKFGISYPDLDPGNRGHDVKLFNSLLRKEAYYDPAGSSYGGPTKLAVLAYRKVNGMDRTDQATPGIFKTLAAEHGGFRLKYPGAGRHVEVDISRQVMVFAEHGKAVDIFPVSTGAPATPTIRGHYKFYSRTPGYNSEGMYYSVYFHGGYATHGYDPVPPYPASHGCVRNPIPDSIFIYNWVRLGMSIYLYD